MPKTRTLDEALDEIDRWSAKMLAEIEGLSPQERDNYFRDAADRVTKKLKSLTARKRRQPQKQK